MTRAEKWQELFVRRGWLVGNTLKAPKGYYLQIKHHSGEIRLWGAGTAGFRPESTDFESDGTFIFQIAKAHQGFNPAVPGSDQVEFYYLWEDIISASCTADYKR